MYIEAVQLRKHHDMLIMPGLGPITKESNQLQLLSIVQFNYNYTPKMFKSITITPFQLQLHLYYAEPFINYVACVLLIVCTNNTIDKQI